MLVLYQRRTNVFHKKSPQNLLCGDWVASALTLTEVTKSKNHDNEEEWVVEKFFYTHFFLSNQKAHNNAK